MSKHSVGWAPPTISTPLVGNAHPTRRALTLVEVVCASMIVGLMAVAALNSLGAATRSALSTGNRAIAAGLADELITEAVQLAYRDPDEPPVFGPEGGEADGPRALFDDIDDYNGWDEDPVESAAGVAVADRDKFRRRATVAYVTPNNPTLATAGNTDLGVKRIRVTVEYDGHVLAEQLAVMTDVN
jgi:prepilin-type N-terminal cleavage/methylation domain-containing protein